jgi:hypothetical protein
MPKFPTGRLTALPCGNSNCTTTENREIKSGTIGLGAETRVAFLGPGTQTSDIGFLGDFRHVSSWARSD